MWELLCLFHKRIGYNDLLTFEEEAKITIWLQLKCVNPIIFIPKFRLIEDFPMIAYESKKIEYFALLLSGLL